MDDKDRLLLNLLRQDARRPLVALARDLGLSRSATQERLAKLRRTGIVAGFTTIEDRQPQQRQSAHLLVRLQAGKTCAQVVPRLRQRPEIVLIHSVAGALDLILRVEADTITEVEATRAAVAATPGIAEATTLVALERHLG
ncbi:Lrp/AsnC family transcriptional regulator [Bosea caraganae]|uniref:Lrp/AsnC family transcriptional regulator n=1 Tax=Bosea caraganae TaxID=2763117 RepID=A0A370L2G8_9HYPH|nr:Lrp/AsnC family transcriptional regulator [Bosea caraganae]RDJ22432.1 Lrp/AsnC family transcriptional regulator [Bosea caraganae]RDJ30391.1 Lrp/AsnC family transcriptional regulator [Bosea caraganae]